MTDPEPSENAAANTAEVSTSGRFAHGVTAGTRPYDYSTALHNLQKRINELKSYKQQTAPSHSLLQRGLAFWRKHAGNVFVVMTLYSVTSAAVLSVVLLERQQQVCAVALDM